jgi:hypothetical protein
MPQPGHDAGYGVVLGGNGGGLVVVRVGTSKIVVTGCWRTGNLWLARVSRYRAQRGTRSGSQQGVGQLLRRSVRTISNQIAPHSNVGEIIRIHALREY